MVTRMPAGLARPARANVCFDTWMKVGKGRGVGPLEPGTGWGIRGKRVVVTGGGRGLGEQIVRLLVAEGAFVATCSRTPHDLTALAASLEAQAPGRLYTEVLDVTEP